MATLYDLELQESNNMIHLFLQNGVSASLKLFRDQIEMAGSLGEAGAKIISDMNDPATDLGKSFAKLQALEKDVKELMVQMSLSQDLAERAQKVFQRNAASLEDLDDAERSAVSDYWIKKKSCTAELIKRGYTYQELYS